MKALPRVLILLALVVTLHLPQRGLAQNGAMDELFEALRIDDVIDVIRSEGVESAGELGREMLGPRVGDGWSATVALIYDADRLRMEFRDALRITLEGVPLDPLIEFFASETGQEIIELEIVAREALQDDAVEEASRDALADAREEGSDRLTLIREYIEVNGLIENNVEGALNANYAFYRGLMTGEAMGRELSEQQVIADVWSQESEIRAETTDWMEAYLLMAYEPLSDEDLEAYIALSKTEAGEGLNRALFAAFDTVFGTVSFNLGAAIVQALASQEL